MARLGSTMCLLRYIIFVRFLEKLLHLLVSVMSSLGTLCSVAGRPYAVHL